MNSSTPSFNATSNVHNESHKHASGTSYREPSRDIAHLTWPKIIFGSIILYLIHVGSVYFYASPACMGGWFGPAMVASPHCRFLFDIVTWSRQWYLAIVWLFVAKLTQDLAYTVEYLLFQFKFPKISKNMLHVTSESATTVNPNKNTTTVA